MNSEQNTITVCTPNAGTLAWEFPQGVTWKSLQIKTTVEETLQLLMTTLMPALAVEPEVGLALLKATEGMVKARQTEQVRELLVQQLRGRTILAG
ncbi:MAG: hypothetical protein A2849_00220 [Candidatus Taylorbacteria bacterium RIFCSPHIGHO2_01_FULL_51_15]|uniref:Uncharacterized protein n=1 Tax=Candidatus Taylorbacteria bacterium RIFCSPHIGHO2_01_FULL_51_15 TaxID=1802304 RepID=A0A1G2MEH4_9BACT|nr:MAG: hypothetical protein A2849_00220 [Candidatus Taylorbacteria bacterium RIFCSPHIGHO2_01_FULL_51_15]